MRATISLILVLFVASFALAQGKGVRRHNPPTPTQTTVRPGQTCGQPYTRPPQRPECRPEPRRDGHRPITLGSVLHDIFSAPVVVVCRPQYVPYPQPVYYTQPQYMPYSTGAYESYCDLSPRVLEFRDRHFVVSRSYPVGTQLTALGEWVPDSVTQRPAYRRETGILEVEQTNGITSWCVAISGGALVTFPVVPIATSPY